ncbi:hypothetical protein Hanom_Chr03g00272391 [Helianthus anomalus]
MFVPNFRRCPLPLKLMSFVLNVSKSCMLCPFGLTQLNFNVKSGYIDPTLGKIYLFTLSRKILNIYL